MLLLLIFNTLLFQIKLPENIINKNDNYISVYYEILDKKFSNLTFEELINNKNLSYKIIPDSEKVANPGKNYWLRFKLKNNTSNNCVIYGLKYFEGTIYIKNENNSFEIHEFNEKTFFWERYLFSNDNIILIPHSKKEVICYIKLRTNLRIGLGFYIASIQYIYNKSILNFIFYSICISIICFVLFFSIILLVKLKDRIYQFYSLYILSLLIYFLTSWTFLYPLFRIQKLYFFAETIPFTFITVFLLLYTREFLNTRLHFPKLDFLILLAAITKISLFAIATIFDLNYLHSTNIDNLLLLPSIIAGILIYRKGVKHIRYYLLSFAILYLGFFLHSTTDFYNNNLIKNSIGKYFDETGMFFFIFSTIEILLFTLSLTDRILTLRKNRELEQAKTIELQNEIISREKENLILKEQYSLHLEDLVEQRTLEIKEANQKLLEQANQINILLKEDNEKLNQDLEILKKVRIMKSNLDYNEFIQTFESEEFVFSFLSELKWKNGFECKKCKFKKYSHTNVPYLRKCRVCKYEESATAYTLLTNIKFPIQKALYLVYVYITFKDIHVNKISEELELRTATCYSFLKRIKETISKQKHLKNENLSWTQVLVEEKESN